MHPEQKCRLAWSFSGQTAPLKNVIQHAFGVQRAKKNAVSKYFPLTAIAYHFVPHCVEPVGACDETCIRWNSDGKTVQNGKKCLHFNHPRTWCEARAGRQRYEEKKNVPVPYCFARLRYLCGHGCTCMHFLSSKHTHTHVRKATQPHTLPARGRTRRSCARSFRFGVCKSLESLKSFTFCLR